MFIGVDGLNLSLTEGTGIARYGKSLLRNLKSLNCTTAVIYGSGYVPKSNSLISELSFYNSLTTLSRPQKSFINRLRKWSATRNQAELIPQSNFIQIPRHFPRDADKILNVHDLFGRAARHFIRTGEFLEIVVQNLDVMHWTSVLPIRVKDAVNIYTIHDVIPLKIPGSVTGDGERYYQICNKIAQDDQAIFTVSETSKRDIKQIFQRDDLKIFNTYLDCSDFFSNSKLNNNFHHNKDHLKKSFGLNHKKYYLYYGAWEPKKNIGNIISAYYLSETELPLVICGAGGWGNERERNLLAQLSNVPGKKKVMQLQYLPDELLKSLIISAKCTVFPSVYEGFGLPIIESMALGTAVITSTEGSIPEIAGNAALLVDPHDIYAISTAIDTLEGDENVQRALEEKGLAHAGNFSAAAFQKRLRSSYQALGLSLK